MTSKIANSNDDYQVCFIEVDDSDNPGPEEKAMTHIDDAFEYDYDAFEYTPTDENIEVVELPSFNDKSFVIR